MSSPIRSASLLAAALSCPLVAAEDPIVVSADGASITTADATAAEAELRLVPGGTDVVPAAELRGSRTANWRDALQSSPGVYVQPRFGADEARLSIRGSGLQRTFHLRGIRLLADGQPISLADGGGDFQATDFALADHIAVWRGANALAWGGATLGGAIDVVSPTGRSAPGIGVRLEGGSFGYLKGVAQAGFAGVDGDAWVGVSWSQQEGFREHASQENLRAQGNVGWRLGESGENRLFLAYADSDSELPGALTRQQMEADPEQASADAVLRDMKRDYPLYRIADRVAGAWGDLRAEASLAYMRKELFHPIAVPGFGTIIEQDSDDWVAATRLVDDGRMAGRGNRIVFGAEAGLGVVDAQQHAFAGASGHEAGALTADAVQTARNAAVYGEWRHEAVDGWWLVGGLQAQWTSLDHDDRLNGLSGAKTWRSLNPKIGVLGEAGEGVQVFANLSRSSEAPTFAEYVQFDDTFTTRPQQDLEQQTAWTGEVGTRGEVDRLRWDLAAYHAQVRDEYLAYQHGPLAVTENADRTVHQGVEAGLDIRLLGDAAEGQRVTLLQTYTWGRFRFDGDAQWGDNQLPGLPEHVWRGELRWELDGWFAGPTAEYQCGWPVDFANTYEADGALLLGARAGYDAGRGFSCFIEGRNLTDEIYVATTGVANPASAPEGQALFNPGDGLAVNAGAAWRW
ncbi:MAG: TonB-dependent receptor [Planctomycetes bacterium]|nr:TonB-dependent receptor [Planctomycetota bacterium]